MNLMTENRQARLMTGNEAIARGAAEAGIAVVATYPGTPSTEIATEFSRLTRNSRAFVQWSANEKVALETAAGASWMGVPALCSMKSLGLNVASDFLLNLNLSGTGEGGLVIVVCDDPRGHSSSNEQDSRFYAKASEIPLLEPATAQQAKDGISYALDLSQRYEIPVMIRSTTRLSHTRMPVIVGSIREETWQSRQVLPRGLFNVPDPHLRHRDLLRKMKLVEREFEDSPLNVTITTEGSENPFGVISSGVCRLYAEEALRSSGVDEWRLLSLGTTYPLPRRTIGEFARTASRLLVVEETDPFIEEQVRVLIGLERLSVDLYGKRTGTVPAWGEMDTDTVSQALVEADAVARSQADKTAVRPAEALSRAREMLVDRPLTFCPGCTHRNVFWALRRVRQRLGGNLIIAGDIGCYSLGVFYDNTMDTMQAMGSGIGTANGIAQMQRFGLRTPVVAVTGDSTFFHACIPALVNARYYNASLTFLILDNGTTAMTGFQPHPGTRDDTEDTTPVSIRALVESIAPDIYVHADGESIGELIDILYDTVRLGGLKVVHVKGACYLERQRRGSLITRWLRVFVDDALCKGQGCRICVGQYRCTALAWDWDRDRPHVIEDQCVRCGACIDVCPHGAIVGE